MTLQSLALAFLSLAVVCGRGSAQPASPAIAFQLPHTVTNGVAITADGKRTFLVLQKEKGDTGPQVAEYVHGQIVPYPDAAWNSWGRGIDPLKGFQHANAMRIGPDGRLWVVDTGAPGSRVLPHGAKLVQIDLAANHVARVYDLTAATRANSYVDDVRFHLANAYLTDAGAPALLVMDLASGNARRVMDGTAPVTAHSPIRAGGKVLRKRGAPAYLHADQLEISPDGQTLYFSPCSGPMWRIETRLLDDYAVKDSERVRATKKFADIATTGGTAIDAKGNLYISDTDRREVLRFTPDGAKTVVAASSAGHELDWVDAMWISADGWLWMPAAQLDRTGQFNGGKDKVQYPVTVYKTKIDAGPPSNDHW